MFEKVNIQDLKFNPFDEISNHWVLISAKKDGVVNTMTASWGQLGHLWGKNVMTVYIRPQRYTKEFVDNSEYFTLSFLPEAEKKEAVKKSCQRTFQALRIDVNREFEVLYEFMEKLPGALKPGGRAAILTFHSGEDKLVKKALKAGYKEGIYSDYSRDVIRPSAQECAQNGRARSTKMRWAVKAE